jgi:hypothetical protein
MHTYAYALRSERRNEVRRELEGWRNNEKGRVPKIPWVAAPFQKNIQ